jgi:hypothetical protein
LKSSRNRSGVPLPLWTPTSPPGQDRISFTPFSWENPNFPACHMLNSKRLNYCLSTYHSIIVLCFKNCFEFPSCHPINFFHYVWKDHFAQSTMTETFRESHFPACYMLNSLYYQVWLWQKGAYCLDTTMTLKGFKAVNQWHVGNTLFVCGIEGIELLISGM